MRNNFSAKKVHFIGLCGIGMSALAQFILNQGAKVSGCDISPDYDLCKNIEFNKTHSESHIDSDLDFLIISNAVEMQHVEVQRAKSLGVKILTYPEALAMIVNDYKLICVTGTHGKSTTTAMIAKILIDAGFDLNVLVGTKVPDLDGKNYRIGGGEYFLIEACEYKDAFLNYTPNILVITNVEADHLDYFKTEDNYFESFRKMCSSVKEGGVIFIKRKFAYLFKGFTNKFSYLQESDKFTLKLFGEHNQENARAGWAVGNLLGIPDENIRTSLSSFKGTWRRAEYKGLLNGALIYDDYAHHPTEIRATLTALKEKYYDKRIICVYQPHQYYRLVSLFDSFVESLQCADLVIVPDIYKVRDSETDLSKVSTESFVEAINVFAGSNHALNGDGFEKTAHYLKSNLTENDVCVIMGAGDIVKITELLNL